MSTASSMFFPFPLNNENNRQVGACRKPVFLVNHRNLMPSLISSRRNQHRGIKMDMTVCNGLFDQLAGTPVPPSSPGSWNGWIIGVLLTLAFPMLKNKWGPLLLFKNKVEKVIQTVEDVTEVIQTVAEKADELADNITEHMPEGKLKTTIEEFDRVVEITAKTAHKAGEIIDKVQEMEEKAETFFDPVVENADEMAKRAHEIATIADEIADKRDEMVKERDEFIKKQDEIAGTIPDEIVVAKPDDEIITENQQEVIEKADDQAQEK